MQILLIDATVSASGAAITAKVENAAGPPNRGESAAVLAGSCRVSSQLALSSNEELLSTYLPWVGRSWSSRWSFLHLSFFFFLLC